MDIIKSKDNIDQIICLGDCFSLGPEPEEHIREIKTIENCMLSEVIMTGISLKDSGKELPTLEGMDHIDPICKAIVENEKWTAEKLGEEGIEFIRKMVISHRDVVGSTLVEFTHGTNEMIILRQFKKH